MPALGITCESGKGPYAYRGDYSIEKESNLCYNPPMNEPIRLSKLMSERGICSRREADRYIEAGLVEVDGQLVDTLGTKVDPVAEVKLLPKAKSYQAQKITILLHKPVGIVSTQAEKGYREAIELITPDNLVGSPRSRFHRDHTKKLAVCGRLDIDSCGLLLLTQDGVLAKSIIGEDCNMEKEYLVRVDQEPTPSGLKQLRYGLKIDGKPLKQATVDLLEPCLLRVVLTEGKKRQIRRMCELIGLKVNQLKRVRIGSYRLEDLPRGKWRYVN